MRRSRAAANSDDVSLLKYLPLREDNFLKYPTSAESSQLISFVMADEEIATKAPESDAHEKSVFPGDTPAQEGPTLGASL